MSNKQLGVNTFADKLLAQQHQELKEKDGSSLNNSIIGNFCDNTTASTSSERGRDEIIDGRGLFPLHRFSVQIGPKKLALKIIKDDGKLIRCPICAKMFGRETNYRMHLESHDIREKVICKRCGKCSVRNTLEEHELECPVIAESTVARYNFRENELRFCCTHCDKKFLFKRDLSIHERSHTGIKPFTCGYCGKSFAQSQFLTIHIRNHTGEKPYICTHCKFKFKDSSALKKHQLLMHSDLFKKASSSRVLHSPMATTGNGNDSGYSSYLI